MPVPVIGLGLLGLGVVGSGVARILLERAGTYEERIGVPLVLRRVLVREPDKQRAVELPAELLVTDPAAILEDDSINIVVEVMGGLDPAYDLVTRALTAGKFVVTANKEVMACHGSELLSVARRSGVDLLFEASVGGGIPLIAPLKRDLLANEITAISAIINGTTNYILTRMSQDGLTLEDALGQAQELGFAEADPSYDVEGTDAAYKLSIMAGLAFRAEVPPESIYREGILGLAPRDFRYADELGYAIKLLATCRRDDGVIRARVHPAFIPVDDLLAKVDGVYNAVQVDGDLTGRVLFQGQGAGSLPTTSAVIADIIDCAHDIALGVAQRPEWRIDHNATLGGMDDLQTRYYIRLTVADRPGVFAEIATQLGINDISIASVIQKEADESAQSAEIVIMTHRAREAALQEAIAGLRRMASVFEVGNCIRVEG
ncbi:MAG: homoserine dehydrogenase [Dehalococcoidia bacterium]